MFGPLPERISETICIALLIGIAKPMVEAVCLLIGISRGLTRGGHADHLAGGVDLRAAGITGLDRGADLEHAGQGSRCRRCRRSP